MSDEINGQARRVRIYFGESDHHHGRSLWSAFLELLRTEGASGATVFRGVAGYGAHSRIHTASIVDLSADLPLVLEWVDTPERVEQLLPRLTEMLDGGLVTVELVEITAYRPHRQKPSR